jgi:cytochrome c553
MGILAAAAASLGLAACGGGQGIDGEPTASLESASARRNTTVAAVQPANTEGRLLASNCFQCHGTMGTGGFEQIRGKSANELIEFQGKTASSDIMAAHAQGYTTDQLRKIAAYLKK